MTEKNIQFEILPFREALVDKISKNIIIETEFNLKDDSKSSFPIQCQFIFSESQLFYQEQYFKQATKYLDTLLKQKFDFYAYHVWSLGTPELPDGKSKEVKEERERIEEYYKTHKFRIITIFCHMMDRFKKRRTEIVEKICPIIVEHVKNALAHKELYSKINNEDFYYNFPLNIFFYVFDKIFDPSYSTKRGNALPVYVLDALKEEFAKIEEITKMEQVKKEGILVIYTNTFIPNRFFLKKAKIEKVEKIQEE